MNKSITLVAALSLTGGFAMAESTFDASDANGDGSITKNEFYGLAYDAGTFSKWDADSDGLLDEGEFNAMEMKTYFDQWDSDGDNNLDSLEFYDGAFNYFDADGSGDLSGSEWQTVTEAGWFDI